MKAKIMTAAFLSLTLLLSGCSEISENTDKYDEPPPINQLDYSEEVSVTENSETSHNSETENSEESHDGEYVYSPPDEVKNVVWNSDFIIEPINYEYYKNDDTITDNVPEEIFSDLENQRLPATLIEWYGEPSDIYMLNWIGLMSYDMNGDGSDDYLVRATVTPKELFAGSIVPEPMGDRESLEMVYLANGASYTPINRTGPRVSHCPYEYILDTRTNGLNDLMVMITGYNTKIVYNGTDSYCELDSYDDQQHCFAFCEKEGNLAKIRFEFGEGSKYDNFYLAAKFKENDVLKETIHYSCYPDGAPRVYDNHSIGSTSGAIVYAELARDVDEKELEQALCPLEILFVEAKQ